ncbi:hypothetical protein DU002_12470 [Corallincola holothuriorum]|uniref:Uncharacterized protein n=1 Tax=Corallincola holothuriorum TaxID=2282215 RepID=A0A368NH03_9GAMM|nr:hypothetical protein [Corallincola holothuriorum]RCU49163.1 hypothetical protein DU002_12470 [Corallincola holothuriorum]
MRLYEIDLSPKPYTSGQLINQYTNEIEYDNQKPQEYDYPDTRRPRLTLRALRKMRHKSDARKAEIADHKKFVHLMYGNQDEAATQTAIEAQKDKLDRDTELEKEKIKQRGELEREKLKQRGELEKEKMKQLADIEKEKRQRNAEREEDYYKALHMNRLKETCMRIQDSLDKGYG